MNALSTIGEIRYDESDEFMTKLLDDYMSEMPDHTFDPSKYDWKYVNVEAEKNIKNAVDKNSDEESADFRL